MVKIIKKRYLFWFMILILLSALGPLIFRAHFLDGSRRIIWLLGVIFGGFSLYSGYYFRRFGLRFWGIFIFPLTFSLINYFSKLVFGSSLITYSYAYFFAAFYVVLALFTFVGDDNHDSDLDKQIPVDDGFKELHDGKN
ncbi:hypothetical protein ATX24_03115 [Oenococcus oeni]|uniref:hypothetical protein n=1 Tax=Oenococcus oeni TaxID=1247 RepID=UPI0008F85272|nr:hypothetical protein [Oenococcus oeni]AWW98306.1 hypothetical protein C5H79_01695 [Oenococcus oeni]OIL51806.1 hypothetical protein ATX19_02895 [Oenococcus oeni]OIL53171.1 hypothetical protein ATX20_03075 [Oenococcus oeni]OIL64856.1 hypothetical protein ATX24_03115 [Oenococcus oeni]OIL69677.1 hypothetical protein ATX29_02950 [Oenococcus oeni]